MLLLVFKLSAITISLETCMDRQMDRSEKDRLFLEYAERLGYEFDVEKGIVTKKGRNVGSSNGRSVNINFSLPDKSLTGITRARAIWLRVHGSVPDGKEVGHISKDLKNDCIGNLELVTHSERQVRVIARGSGKLNPRALAKLDVEKVNQMRILSKRTTERWSLNRLAKEFGVSKPTALHAVNGTIWKDATEPPNLELSKHKGVGSPKEKKFVQKVSKYEQHRKVIRGLLNNNPVLSNAALMRFLKMRHLDISMDALKRIALDIKRKKDVEVSLAA